MINNILTTGVIFLISQLCYAQTEIKNIHGLMNAWHEAAATANEDIFFGSMTDKGIYLGTDKTEKWTRDEMKEWSKEYFNRESAWDFTVLNRDIYLSKDGNTAWFNEKLDTWMGVCKGTGVLVKQDNNWKIALYDLSVTVDNDNVQQFIELEKD